MMTIHNGLYCLKSKLILLGRVGRRKVQGELWEGILKSAPLRGKKRAEKKG